jgi:Holliday junction resolvase RusA-like endonuclease
MNELTLTIPGTIRSKKNSKRIFARGPLKKVLPSKAYTVWEAAARSYLLSRGYKKLLECAVAVEAHIYYRGRRPDLSGALESVGDCLEGIVWVNDAQIESWDRSRLHHDKDNPRTEIIVRWE